MNDIDVQKLINSEANRQRDGLELIPSENYASKDVLAALGSVFTNKYSEGYPGKRYYGGQEYTDQLEELAIDRAKQLFSADHANVQLHSGSQANAAVYYSWLEHGDTVLAMALDQGGHLSHGHSATILSKQFNFVHYGMKNLETGEIDFDDMREKALKHRPKIIVAGYSAYPRELDYQKFKSIADEVNAVLMADVAHISGLIAGKVLENPFDYGFHVVTSTTHKTLRGPRGGIVLTKGVVSNPLQQPEKKIENLPTIIDRMVFPGMQGGPHMNVVAAKAVCFNEALKPEFTDYAKQVVDNAKTLAESLINKGCKLITNGTDNHLMVIDVVTSFGVDGKEAEQALEKTGLYANKNSIPFDTNPPFRPSGLRLGTPAITTRGLVARDMDQLAMWITNAIKLRSNPKDIEKIKKEITDFSSKYPIPEL